MRTIELKRKTRVIIERNKNGNYQAVPQAAQSLCHRLPQAVAEDSAADPGWNKTVCRRPQPRCSHLNTGTHSDLFK